MNCPSCNSPTRVLSTRDKIQRRRECINGHRFLTTETFAQMLPPRATIPDTIPPTLDPRQRQA